MDEVLNRLNELHPEQRHASPENPNRPPTTNRRRMRNLDSVYNRLIEEFNTEADVSEMLEKAGWNFHSENEEYLHFTRPGKTTGISGSIRKDNQIFHVFSSSTNFVEGESYSPFQVFALLEFGIHKGGEYFDPLAYLEHQKEQKQKGDKIDLILPSLDVSISACAEHLFRVFGEKKELFYRGGKVQEIETLGSEDMLSTVGADRLCSLMERYFRTITRHEGKEGGKIMKASPCKKDIASRLLETDAARQFLPEIRILAKSPILSKDGRVLQKGFDAESKTFVLRDLQVKIPVLENGIRWLKGLLRDFSFASPGDRSRAIAALLTPALVLAGFFKRVPICVVEADQSQTGKGYFVQLNATMYDEQVRFVTQRQGGVGSFDESLAARLAEGNAFISLDNLRGRLDSPYLEALLTADGLFSVRIPYRGEMQIDSRSFCLFLTSNGVELTKDLANRMSLVRLRKQPSGYSFKSWKEGDLIEHVAANRPFLLGAVFAVLQQWITEGRPKTSEQRHSFRDWAQSMDWIIQNLFEEAPLLDGFIEAKERSSNTNLSFIRQIGVLVERAGRLRMPLTATEIFRLCEEDGLEIPNHQERSEEHGRMQIGKVFRHALNGKESIEVDDYRIHAIAQRVQRDDRRGSREMKTYEFHRR